jgi:hypothetical protein
METLLNAVRYKVSADKYRYMKGQYDLDLTYITDRLIGKYIRDNFELKLILAMAFPAYGMESTYRNRIDGMSINLQFLLIGIFSLH